MFGDEASFWLDGTLHQTWSRVGVQPRVDTFGERKTAHVFGAVSLEKRPRFLYEFADVFNGRTFLGFLQQIVRRSRRRKVFLVIDNGPCHNLDEDGKAWCYRASCSMAFEAGCVMGIDEARSACAEVRWPSPRDARGVGAGMAIEGARGVPRA